jgi:hypothetical protein
MDFPLKQFMALALALGFAGNHRAAVAASADFQLPATSSGTAGAQIGAQLGSIGANSARTTKLSPAKKAIGASATPGQGPAQGGTVSASASRTTSFTIDCAATTAPQPGSNGIAYPLGIETACIKTGVSRYVLDLCPTTENGGACGSGTSGGWIQQAITPNGAFKASSEIRLTVGTCANDQCAITLIQTSVFQGNGANLKQQGYQAMGKGLTQSSGVVRSTVGIGVYVPSGQAVLPGRNQNSGAYIGNTLANGGDILSCIKAQKTALQNGKLVYTCSKSSSVYFGGQSCKNTSTCVKWQTGTTRWASQCVSSIAQSKSTCTTATPVSTTACTTTTPVKQCTLANQSVTENCSIGYTPAVAVIGGTLSCGTPNSGLWYDELTVPGPVLFAGPFTVTAALYCGTNPQDVTMFIYEQANGHYWNFIQATFPLKQSHSITTYGLFGWAYLYDTLTATFTGRGYNVSLQQWPSGQNPRGYGALQWTPSVPVLTKTTKTDGCILYGG